MGNRCPSSTTLALLILVTSWMCEFAVLWDKYQGTRHVLIPIDVQGEQDVALLERASLTPRQRKLMALQGDAVEGALARPLVDAPLGAAAVHLDRRLDKPQGIVHLQGLKLQLAAGQQQFPMDFGAEILGRGVEVVPLGGDAAVEASEPCGFLVEHFSRRADKRKLGSGHERGVRLVVAGQPGLSVKFVAQAVGRVDVARHVFGLPSAALLDNVEDMSLWELQSRFLGEHSVYVGRVVLGAGVGRRRRYVQPAERAVILGTVPGVQSPFLKAAKYAARPQCYTDFLNGRIVEDFDVVMEFVIEIFNENVLGNVTGDRNGVGVSCTARDEGAFGGFGRTEHP